MSDSARAPELDDDLDSALANLEPYAGSKYWSSDFWNAKYKSDTSHYEWLAPWALFEDNVLPHLRSRTVALDLGCGTSHLGRCLVDAGFQKVICLDFSEPLITHLRQKNKDEKRLEFQVGDVTSMRLPQKSFDAVFDKATLDCVCSGPDGDKLARKAVLEVARVLKMNGVYVLLSYGLPKSRTDILEKKTGLTMISKWQVTNSDNEYPVHCLYILQKTRDM